MTDSDDNFRAIIEKVDPTHTSIIINKYNIVAMTQNKGDMRGTLTKCFREVVENTQMHVKNITKLTDLKS